MNNAEHLFTQSVKADRVLTDVSKYGYQGNKSLETFLQSHIFV